MTYPPSWIYPPGQLTAQAAQALAPEEYVTAEETGLLDQHLSRAPQPPTEGQLTRADLKVMTPEQIEQAREQGQFDHLMQGDAA